MSLSWDVLVFDVKLFTHQLKAFLSGTFRTITASSPFPLFHNIFAVYQHEARIHQFELDTLYQNNNAVCYRK